MWGGLGGLHNLIVSYGSSGLEVTKNPNYFMDYGAPFGGTIECVTDRKVKLVLTLNKIHVMFDERIHVA